MPRFRPKPLKATERLVIVDSPDDDDDNEEESFTLLSGRRQSQADKHATRRTTRSLSHSDSNVMFPEEESEKHLQEVISKQNSEIPTPTFKLVDNYDEDEQEFRRPWKCPRKYIEYTALVSSDMLSSKVAEYDIDEEDELFLEKLNSSTQILSKDQFEFMIDRFEAECDQQEGSEPSIESIERLFSNFPYKMLYEVYNYWIEKRHIENAPLVSRLKPPNDLIKKHKPWRRNDAASYKKILQLRQEMEHARTLIEMIRKREKMKRDLLLINSDLILGNLPNFETDHEISSPEISLEISSPEISQEFPKKEIEEKIPNEDILLLEENFECVRSTIHERIKGR